MVLAFELQKIAAGWMDKEDVYVHTMGYESTIKKYEIMPFAATQKELEIIILSKSKRERQIAQYHLYVESKIWHKWTYLQNRKGHTDEKTEAGQGWVICPKLFRE